MTFAEMTPDKWGKLCWIVVTILGLWGLAWLWWSVRKVPKDETGESPEQYEKFD